MRIKIYIKDLELDKVLEQLGECVCDSPGRALQMYKVKQLLWAERGYQPTLCYEDISDPAAQSLGRRGGAATSKAKSAAARANGRKGGRPRKNPE